MIFNICKHSLSKKLKSCIKYWFTFTEINECELGTHACDKNANCLNTNGSYNCRCKPGFSGNESFCNGEFYSLLMSLAICYLTIYFSNELLLVNYNFFNDILTKFVFR